MSSAEDHVSERWRKSRLRSIIYKFPEGEESLDMPAVLYEEVDLVGGVGGVGTIHSNHHRTRLRHARLRSI